MIESYRFGSMTVRGRTYRSDLMIVQGRVIPDWWRREGHEVDVSDVTEILQAKPRTLVVGQGHPGRMQVLPPLRKRLEEAAIELIEEPTDRAVHTFNRLFSEGRDVAGAFHLTC